ncbi:MAG: thermonuclease family protein [Alicyclobacillus sp.]|nr:thermonuclease family protein [Alicyclobacillus sp.]
MLFRRLFQAFLSVTAVAAVTAVSFVPSQANPALVPATVTRDVDGDTIHVRLPNGKDTTVRMLLIDTPEDVKPNTPVEPYSLAAASFARRMLPVGKHIYLQEGLPGHQYDKYGRLLAFVYVSSNDMYNEDVVRRGLARVAYIYPPNTQHLSALRQAEAYAKRHHLGIWSIPGYVTPSGYDWRAAERAGSLKASSNSSHVTAKTMAPAIGSIRLIAFTRHVHPGDEATLEIQTQPGARATIEVDYKSGPSKARGLYPQVADAQGHVTWTWFVGTNTTPGSWPVVVTVGKQQWRASLDVE